MSQIITEIAWLKSVNDQANLIFLNCDESGNEIPDTAKAIKKYYTVIENNKCM